MLLQKKKIKSPTSSSPLVRGIRSYMYVCVRMFTCGCVAQNSGCIRVVWVSSPQSYYLWPSDDDDNDSRPLLLRSSSPTVGHGRENSVRWKFKFLMLSLLRAFEAEASADAWHIITARCMLYIRWQSSARRVDGIRYPRGFRIGDDRKRGDKVGEGRPRRCCRVERGEKAT